MVAGGAQFRPAHLWRTTPVVELARSRPAAVVKMSKSKKSRDVALKREMKRRPPGRRGPGQPKGTRHSLLANPKRFRMAAWQALTGLDIENSSDRARLVIVALDETGPIQI